MALKWIKLRDFPKETLSEARKQIHQAVQLIAITGRCFNPKDTGDTFAALIWLDKQKVLSSRYWNGNKHRSALNISNLELKIIDLKNNPIASLQLNNETYDSAFTWLSEQANKLGYDTNRLNKELPYQIPVYRYANGKPFGSGNISILKEIEKYYANANSVLEEIRVKNSNASVVSCWPHHFDIATLLTIEKGRDQEQTKTIGVGMSPGDDSYNEPYFYISPWPYPEDKKNLPELMPGCWHTEGWFGAVLTSSKIIQFKNEYDQLKITKIFLKTGIENLKKLL